MVVKTCGENVENGENCGENVDTEAMEDLGKQTWKVTGV